MSTIICRLARSIKGPVILPFLRGQRHHDGGDRQEQRQGLGVRRGARAGGGRNRGGTFGQVPRQHARRHPGDAGNPGRWQQGSLHATGQVPRQVRCRRASRRIEIDGDTQGPITEAALNEPAASAAWRTIPFWFLYGSKDKNIPPDAHAFMAGRAGARRRCRSRAPRTS